MCYLTIQIIHEEGKGKFIIDKKGVERYIDAHDINVMSHLEILEQGLKKINSLNRQ